MKKRLFTVLAVVLVYSLIVVGFNFAENSGLIHRALSYVGLEGNPAYAAESPNTFAELTNADTGFQSLIDPLPRPPYPKPKPKPSPDEPSPDVFTF